MEEEKHWKEKEKEKEEKENDVHDDRSFPTLPMSGSCPPPLPTAC